MCTGVRFNGAEGGMYFGRNLDWSCGYGEKPRVMPKGFPVRYQFMDDALAAHAATTRTTPCSLTVETTPAWPWPA